MSSPTEIPKYRSATLEAASHCLYNKNYDELSTDQKMNAVFHADAANMSDEDKKVCCAANSVMGVVACASGSFQTFFLYKAIKCAIDYVFGPLKHSHNETTRTVGKVVKATSGVASMAIAQNADKIVDGAKQVIQQSAKPVMGYRHSEQVIEGMREEAFERDVENFQELPKIADEALNGNFGDAKNDLLEMVNEKLETDSMFREANRMEYENAQDAFEEFWDGGK
ncbi:MAG: hypothetical protein R6V36_08655 [Psychroflexus sp.]